MVRDGDWVCCFVGVLYLFDFFEDFECRVIVQSQGQFVQLGYFDFCFGEFVYVGYDMVRVVFGVVQVVDYLF